MHHRYFAGHGYACLRVDIRGSGDSDGQQGVFAIQHDQEDTLEVLKWIAAQPWSDGQVGMFGISWGGFPGDTDRSSRAAGAEGDRAVRVRARPLRLQPGLPRRLRAAALDPLVDARCSATSRARPIRSSWATRWREMWMERLENNTPQIVSALKHQTFDEYWKSRAHRSRAHHGCPFYAVSGWADGSYVGAVERGATQAQGAAEGTDRTVGPPVSRISACRDPRSASCRRRCAGTTTGCAARTTGVMNDPTLDRVDAAGGAGEELLRANRPAAGWRSRNGLRRASGRSAAS